MITALLKASLFVVLSLLLFSTTSLAQSKQAPQQDAETVQVHEGQIPVPATYEEAKQHVDTYSKALANLPEQGSHFTPEQYEMAEAFIKQQLALAESRLAAFTKPK